MSRKDEFGPMDVVRMNEADCLDRCLEMAKRPRKVVQFSPLRDELALINISTEALRLADGLERALEIVKGSRNGLQFWLVIVTLALAGTLIAWLGPIVAGWWK